MTCLTGDYIPCLTTEQAADRLGISPSTLRGWVMRGTIEPVRRGARPMLFRREDVEIARSAHRPAEWHQALDDLATRWEMACLQSGL